MTKYVAGPPAGWWNDDSPQKTGQTVHELERTPRNTGLLDSAGNKLFAVDDRPPAGFIRFGETTP